MLLFVELETVAFTESVTFYASCKVQTYELATAIQRRQPAGSAFKCAGAGGRRFLEEDVCVCRPRLPRRGRLHGSRELGDGPRRRREIRLHAAVGDHAFQPDGDPA